MRHTLKWTRSPAATHTNANRQRNRTRATYQQNSTKSTKAMDMSFHWLRCRDSQGQFWYYWRPGTQNLADYFTKHHPATHHKSLRPTILTAVNNPEYRKLFVTQESVSPRQINVKPSGNKKELLKIQGTLTKTSVITNSFVKTLFQTPKFQKMIAARSA